MAIGKRVADDLYIHLSSLHELEDSRLRTRIEESLGVITSTAATVEANVAKLNLRSGRVSLLAYPGFDQDPFPELAASWIYDPTAKSAISHRSYTNSLNPPILHRKELLVPLTHPGRDEWARRTAAAEEIGLFEEPATIGFRLNWERLVASKGYRISEGEFLPLGNETDAGSEPFELANGLVQRHLTALSRGNFSAPVQSLLRHGLLTPDGNFFDYGCGRGDDIATLKANGFSAHGWDPHYAADQPTLVCDVVNLGFVVNVIEDPAERVEALQKAFKLTRKVMSIGVMLYGSETPGRPFRDGVITARGTFQKYFNQSEFKDYVEQVLHQEAFMVGPGIALVFADQDAEQRFSASRYRSRGIAARLLTNRVARVRPALEASTKANAPAKRQKPSHAELELTQMRALLDSVWARTLDLGRWPDPDEVDDLGEISSQAGGLPRVIRLLSRNYDQELLAVAARARADDVRLYLATQHFSKRPAFGHLEPRLRSDVKAFFGDYRSAQDAGLHLLSDAADSFKRFEACKLAAEQGLGWLHEQHSLQLHVSMVDRLPALLRAYVACGLLIWDSISEVQLVKIHIASEKLTLMEFDDFDTSSTPLLRRRIKINIRTQDYDLFEYEPPAHPKPLLYRKSRYLHEDYPGYAEQLAFDEELEGMSILGDSDFGPTPEALSEMLEFRRLAIVGMKLVRSERLPDLDQACGKNFTYRSLIECGETQQRLGLRNLPLKAATYNALYDLSTQVLDPIIDYFGGIRLTYGFCSSELGRHITRRVAPKLDQHAACEVGLRKKPICDRLGAACDFIVEDENMRDVADWIIANLPFDRLYFYGADRPIHISYGPQNSRAAYQMVGVAGRALVPKRYVLTR